MEKINVTPFNLAQVIELNEYELINGYIVGSNKFGLRQVVDYDLTMIEELRANTDKKIYVAVNKLIHNRELKELETYLIRLSEIGIDNIIFSDMGVYQLVKRLKLNIALVYNTETTITNQYFSEFANEYGIECIELAKEITRDEIVEIAMNKQSEISINIQGHLYMYQSVRKLIDNYATTQNVEFSERDYYLYDQERNLHYPIVQNEQGTHLLASVDVSMINRLDRLVGNNIDYFRIDGFGYKKDEYLAIVKLYLEALADENYLDNKQTYADRIKIVVPHKSMGTGFYFKKTIY
jgi:putative protease